MENSLKGENTRLKVVSCLLRSLYAGQKPTARTGHGTMNWLKIGKGVHQAVYCHPAYLTYMQSTSCIMLGLENHKLESRLPGELSTTTHTHTHTHTYIYMNMNIYDTALMTESKEELKNLDEGEREE